MRIAYQVLVRHEVYQTLRQVHSLDRDRILKFIEDLAHDPFAVGHHSEDDSTGRVCEVKMIGRFAVFFWSDHAEKEVRIVDLIDVDPT